jgi:hypothetical protein
MSAVKVNWLDECQVIHRVMQIIRLLRELQLELEQATEEPQARALGRAVFRFRVSSLDG